MEKALLNQLKDVALFLLEKNQEAELELTRYQQAFQKDSNLESSLASADASPAVQLIRSRHRMVDRVVKELLKNPDDSALWKQILELLQQKPTADKPSYSKD